MEINFNIYISLTHNDNESGIFKLFGQKRLYPMKIVDTLKENVDPDDIFIHTREGSKIGNLLWKHVHYLLLKGKRGKFYSSERVFQRFHS